ncbi:hypothetical protein [Lactococcus lactis]|uniref:hypothetical protein n=1 Tax=Lactococcus lactis TaxID=1358 RepID=UPI00288FADBD|nr:hypothetical protein [Lactococcus lactis]MDT2895537.1 hypothetical protein [Lactococcus lactis]
MTEKTKLCGFQPTGNSEDIPKPPKFKPANTDKIQEHLLPYSKEMVQKIRDEKMQLVTADEFVKLHKESLTAIRENDKLQEQLNTAKYFFKNILDVDPNLNKGYVSHLENCVRVMKNSAEKALAAIGGDDEL